MVEKPGNCRTEVVQLAGDASVAAGRAHTQQGWYELAALYASGLSVLDVGCGLGKGLETLAQNAAGVTGQDLDERLRKAGVLINPIENFPDSSFDLVTSIEVIEHVEDPKSFVANLFRISRRQVFITTPNWTASRCQWPYHLREFTPRELCEIVAPYGSVTLFRGTPSGDRYSQVFFKKPFFLLNDLLTWKATAWWMRYFHKLLTLSWKIGSNIAVCVAKPKSATM